MNSIELDCAPGSPRPGDLLPDVIKGTALKLDANAPDHAFFGCWTWYIPEEQNAAYEAAKATLELRIKRLYAAGAIRYGSW